jgi:hypothetical protein
MWWCGMLPFGASEEFAEDRMLEGCLCKPEDCYAPNASIYPDFPLCLTFSKQLIGRRLQCLQASIKGTRVDPFYWRLNVA